MKTLFLLGATMYYTNSDVSLPARNGADRLVYKSAESAAVSIVAKDGAFNFQAPATPGRYAWQQYAGTRVVATGVMVVEQDLATAPDDYDPRSQAEKTLEALDAKIAGRALTIQQSKVTVDGRSIEYMNSIDELLKWRQHFAEQVAKEQGHASPTTEICVLRRD